MKNILVFLLILCLLSSAALNDVYCNEDEKDPPDGYIEPGPDLAEPAPKKPPFGLATIDLVFIAIIIVIALLLCPYAYHRIKSDKNG